MKDKPLEKTFNFTIPTLWLIVSAFLGSIGYVYSLDKRVSLVEQNIVHIEQDKIELEKQVEQDNIQQDNRLTRMEDKMDKIYEILVSRDNNKKISSFGH